ncbi:MAG: IclR family transcriptional regulator [Acidimicrobiales bacterium]|nr:IclR family transcriptional regulator [Acidimicrobiales bacterium]
MAPQQPRSGERASRPGIEVINRAVDLLAAFTQGPGSVLTLAELARRTGLPKPTLHRLLAALEVQGLVDRTASGYQLGIRLFELGEHVPRKHKLREAALPFMQDLFEASHDTVHLAVLDGTDVVYLERIHGHRALNVASRVGGRLPAHCTGVGKALLAYNPEAALRVMAMPLPPRTAYTITSHQVLAEELQRIRQTGISYDREENSLGITCVAAPIVVDGHAVGAVSVTSAPGSDVERYASAVRTAALGIRRSLGRTPILHPTPPRARASKKEPT